MRILPNHWIFRWILIFKVRKEIMEFHHTSVLLHETLDGLLTNPDGIYIDCTLGGGGHSLALSRRLRPDAWLIGIDQDGAAVAAAGERLQDIACRHTAVRDNFSHILSVMDSLQIPEADGFLFDLGVSSYQLDDDARGFSYMHDNTLDMRMDQRRELTAETVVNEYSEEELERVIREYGEERWARRITRFIAERRREKPIRTTGELVGVIKAAIPVKARTGGPHPAKRTFQAIRIEVNGELSILRQTMKDCAGRLKKGGRIAVITFQSLEDRIIKQTFKEMSQGCICPPDLPVCVCGHKPEVRLIVRGISPSEAEIEENPRSRSARLRVVEKL